MLSKRPLTFLALLVIATVAVATVTGAVDRKAPRIVAAVMVDSDLDARADRLRLTYSERVVHPADGTAATRSR